VGLKLKYQFDEELIETYISTKHKNNEDDELPAKKLKLNDNKKIAILEILLCPITCCTFYRLSWKIFKDFWGSMPDTQEL